MKSYYYIDNDRAANEFVARLSENPNADVQVIGQETMNGLQNKLESKGIKVTVTDYFNVDKFPENRSKAKTTDLYTAYVSSNQLIEFTHRVGFMTEEVIMIPYTQNKKTYGFSILGDERNYRDYLPEDYEVRHPKPNFAGILTDKKAVNWEQWLTARAEAYDRESYRREGQVDKFRDRIQSIDPTAEFRTYQGPNATGTVTHNASGKVTKGNITLEYTVRNGKVYTTLSVDRQESDPEKALDLFIQMSDNGYEDPTPVTRDTVQVTNRDNAALSKKAQ